MSQPLPTEAQVRTTATELLNAAAAGGGRPTASALAAHLGISRPQLYRHTGRWSTSFSTLPPSRQPPAGGLPEAPRPATTRRILPGTGAPTGSSAAT
jgi:hypothetical protein